MAQLNDLLVMGQSTLLGPLNVLSGKVGIGTSDPSYKLHVMGDIYANGGWLRTSGAAGWYNETHGGGWYMTDSTYIRNYNSKEVLLNAPLTVQSEVSGGGIKIGGANLTAIGNAVIFQNTDAIRFGSCTPGRHNGGSCSNWDWNEWAGLKYDSSNKYIYLGLADSSIFSANSAQSGGRILTPGIQYFHVGNQTSYYMDSSGNVVGSTIRGTSIHNGGHYIAYPNGNTYTTTSSQIIGYLRISLPTAAYKSASMLKFKVSIYNYVTNTSTDYIIGGYVYTDGTWYQTTAVALGPANSPLNNLTVRFAYDNTRNYVYIGEPSTVWTYPQISISDITVGYSGTCAHLYSGWGIDFTADAPPTITSTCTNTAVGGAGSVKAMTKAEFNALTSYETGTLYCITDN